MTKDKKGLGKGLGKGLDAFFANDVEVLEPKHFRSQIENKIRLMNNKYEL